MKKREGAVQGTLGVSAKLSDIRAKENLNLDAMNLLLKSSFQVNLSPTFQPISIRSRDQLHMAFRNMTVADPSFTATLPSLKLALNTKEDLLETGIRPGTVHSLKQTYLLNLTMQGQASLNPPNEFNLRYTRHLLSMLVNLLAQVSGPLMEGNGYPLIRRGRLELSVQACRSPSRTH